MRDDIARGNRGARDNRRAGDSPEGSGRGARRQHVRASIALVALALALYWPATAAWFYQDDLQWLAGTLTFEPRSLLNVDAHQHFYRPVISLYFWAATPLFNGSPVLFHWAGNLLHGANGVLVFLLGGRLGFKPVFAFLAAVYFLSIPAHIEATAWVSALAEPLTTFFGIISIYLYLHSRAEGGAVWTVLSLIAFCLALMTHESAAMLLPLLLVADWALVPAPGQPSYWAQWSTRVLRFWPYGVALSLYLIVDLSVNSRSYLVEEGHYRVGLHAIPNLLGYVVTLYAGKRNLLSFVVVALALAALLLRGTPRVIFATAWLVLTILPFAFFTWSNTSRYAYTPAVGMAFLICEGLAWLDARMERWFPRPARTWLTGLLAAFVAVRFMLFASENIRNFTEATERYRQFATDLRQRHPHPPPGGVIAADAQTVDQLHHRYLEALVQWEFRNPSLRLAVRP